MNPSTNETLYCIGCGAAIQSENPKEEGFIPKSALEKRTEFDDIYCQRCFRLRHYNDPQDIELDEDAYMSVLNEISQEKALVILVVDLFDFNGSFISGIQRFKGDNPLLIVANKLDILPKNVKENRLRQWVIEQSAKFGAKADDVALISAKNAGSVKGLLQTIEDMRNGHDVYVVGTTNVGKSTLINQIINLTIEEKDLVTTSYYPGTTLGKIEIPLADGASIIDTPGIIQHHQLSYYLDKSEMKQVMPRKRINPKVYQINPGQTLFLGGVGRIDYKSGPDKQPFVVYVSGDLYIHRTKTENAESAYQSLVTDRLTPPNNSDNSLPEFSTHEYRTNEESDIAISGLGWISVPKDAVVSVHAPNGIDVYFRKAMI